VSDDKNKTADFAKPAERVPLHQLANQGVEELLTQLGRALPETEGQVGVSAFNSSI
jgi:FXSXX-COOH protein